MNKTDVKVYIRQQGIKGLLLRGKSQKQGLRCVQLQMRKPHGSLGFRSFKTGKDRPRHQTWGWGGVWWGGSDSSKRTGIHGLDNKNVIGSCWDSLLHRVRPEPSEEEIIALRCLMEKQKEDGIFMNNFIPTSTIQRKWWFLLSRRCGNAHGSREWGWSVFAEYAPGDKQRSGDGQSGKDRVYPLS